MTFGKYSILKKELFQWKNFTLRPIKYEDRIPIMKWRNDQLYHLRQKHPLTKNQQDIYFKNIISKLFNQKEPSQLLFSLLKEKKMVGYGGLVHIDWDNKNAEVSFVMDTMLELEYFKHYWGVYLKLIEMVAFEELKLNKIFIYSYNLRPKLYEVTDENCYLLEAKFKEHAIYNSNFIDVNIHSKLISSYEKSTNIN